MNAAGRLVYKRTLPHHMIAVNICSKKYSGIILMIFMIMLSALGAIYTTDMARTWQATYQHNLTEQHRLHVERSQLLLERSAWMSPTRIATLAERHFEMITPPSQAMVIVYE